MLEELPVLGPLIALLADPAVSQVMVTGPSVFHVEREGRLERVPARFEDNEALLGAIHKLASMAGGRIDEAHPLFDGRLPDGSHLSVALPPVAVDGPALVIQRPSPDVIPAEDFLREQVLSEAMLEFCRACVKARLNILVAGGRGGEKTALLNLLASYIPEDQRIVSIQEVTSLQFPQSNVLRLEARPLAPQGGRPVTVRDLVAHAGRMAADRLVIGEVRGGEAAEIVSAINAGCDGALLAIHASSPRAAIRWMEVMASTGEAGLAAQVAPEQVAKAIHLIVQVARLSDGAVRVTYLTECVGMDGATVALQDIFVFERTGRTEAGRYQGRFRATGIRPRFWERFQVLGLQPDRSVLESLVAVE